MESLSYLFSLMVSFAVGYLCGKYVLIKPSSPIVLRKDYEGAKWK